MKWITDQPPFLFLKSVINWPLSPATPHNSSKWTAAVIILSIIIDFLPCLIYNCSKVPQRSPLTWILKRIFQLQRNLENFGQSILWHLKTNCDHFWLAQFVWLLEYHQAEANKQKVETIILSESQVNLISWLLLSIFQKQSI